MPRVRFFVSLSINFSSDAYLCIGITTTSSCLSLSEDVLAFGAAMTLLTALCRWVSADKICTSLTLSDTVYF